MTTNSLKKVLIVDDEPDICELAEITLSRMGLDTSSANTLSDARARLEASHFDLCLTDMNLPDGDGIDLVEFIQAHYPSTPVAVITAYGNMECAIRALKAGAFDFVSKPVDLQVLRTLVNQAIKLPQSYEITTHGSGQEDELIGDSSAMQKLKRKVNKLARSQAPVFIHGESGSGKERVARMIHKLGARAEKPFVPINCGAIPAELMESEFFGHKKGSFTGATQDKQGLFPAANGGTLFLDEVADLPLPMQVKLLRAIQEKAVRPVGEQHELAVDVRILSASHKDLGQLVKNGQFREDLYYRINVIELEIPSLRERTEDIPNLTHYLLTRLASKANLEHIPTLTDDAMKSLQNYTYPGNVRELENILERALALADDDNTIDSHDLNLNSGMAPPTESATPKETKTASDPVQAMPVSLAEQEKAAILEALEQTRWNKTAAAKRLGLSLRQLRYRLEKLNIE